MVNASMLVGPMSELVVPVSCVERGRWRYDSEKFSDSRHFSCAGMRAQKNQQVSYCLMSRGDFAADQGAIWEEVGRKQGRMRSHSDTGAVNDVYVGFGEELGDFCNSFRHQEGQVGAMVFINGRFSCLDTFDTQPSLQKVFKKLVESYALDAIDMRRQKAVELGAGAARDVLEKISATTVAAYPSVGIGKDLRISAGGLSGSCLSAGGRVIHLAVFSTPTDGAERPGAGISRPSRRARSI